MEDIQIKKIISLHLDCNEDEICNIEKMKKGMTNISYVFSINNIKYIIRIPKEKTNSIINRENEYNTYNIINKFKISDDVIYYDKNTGIKISKYIENARLCNPFNEEDVKQSMKLLKKFHDYRITVDYKFDLFKMIDYYESNIADGINTIINYYPNYKEIKSNIFTLKTYIDSINRENILCHIDSICDNFIFDDNNNLHLIDWEYAGANDPYVDIAMFCVYACYEKNNIDKTIDYYFDYKCNKEIRIKIYAYIAIVGLLWSNWCICNSDGIHELSSYAKAQYNYAVEYYNLIKKEITND